VWLPRREILICRHLNASTFSITTSIVASGSSIV
jgi:hypothetical protein